VTDRRGFGAPMLCFAQRPWPSHHTAHHGPLTSADHKGDRQTGLRGSNALLRSASQALTPHSTPWILTLVGRHPAISSRHTIQTLAHPIHTLAHPIHTLAHPMRTLAHPMRTLAHPTHTLAHAGPHTTARFISWPTHHSMIHH